MPRSIEIDNKIYLPAAKHNTICEVHRKIYWKLKNISPSFELNEEIAELTKEAYVMAKKMSNKLLQYSRNLGSDWYQAHRLDGGKIDDNE